MKIFLATKNQKKLIEMRRILAPLGMDVVSESELDITLPEIAETGTTFAENARIKSDFAAEFTGLPAVADDSGLCVDALGGEPGVYSARYGGEGLTDDDRTDRLLYNLRNIPENKRTAKFVSAISLTTLSGKNLCVSGECAGVVAFEKSGRGGFGYDPVFLVGEKSFAELSDSEKDEISHRGKAMRKFAEMLPEFLKKEDMNNSEK